jgi:hypothetical protein
VNVATSRVVDPHYSNTVVVVTARLSWSSTNEAHREDTWQLSTASMRWKCEVTWCVWSRPSESEACWNDSLFWRCWLLLLLSLLLSLGLRWERATTTTRAMTRARRDGDDSDTRAGPSPCRLGVQRTAFRTIDRSRRTQRCCGAPLPRTRQYWRYVRACTACGALYSSGRTNTTNRQASQHKPRGINRTN